VTRHAMTPNMQHDKGWLDSHLDRVLVLILVVALATGGVVIGSYLYEFGSNPPSKAHGTWGEFGDYIGGTLNPVVSMLALIAILLTLKVQAKELAISSEQLRRTAIAATESSDVARLAMVASNRAYVHYNGCRWISHPTQAGRVVWRIRPGWKNAGNTPARGLRVGVRFELVDEALPADHQFEVPVKPEIVALPAHDSITSNPTNFFGEDLIAVKEGKKHLYLMGVAVYNDIFPGTPQRLTRYCCKVNWISGDPGKVWDDKAPVEITFSFFGAFNCSDDDCVTQSLPPPQAPEEPSATSTRPA
jgi:hypothetical protein